MDNEVEYGRPRKDGGKPKRHPLNILFDPLYPLFVAAVFVTAAVWYFDIPTQKFIGFNLSQTLRNWMP